MKTDLTNGKVVLKLLKFAAPLIIGNILQQIYSITDTLILGRYVGETALAAAGSTYTLTTFLYSIMIGLCMGSGALISYYRGSGNEEKTRVVISSAFLMILLVTLVLEAGTLLGIKSILTILRTPSEVYALALEYTRIILAGMLFVFFYNYYAYVLRAVGNSMIPMYILAFSTGTNVILDIVFVVVLQAGVAGAAWATVIAQLLSGIGIMGYCIWKEPIARITYTKAIWNPELCKEILRMSFGASIQQSVMNFGILMIQGLVNSFGAATMAAFTVAVKIDTLAYMPAQEYANAFSLFISQNHGAKKEQRIKEGIRCSFILSALFCMIISIIVCLLAKPFMQIFLKQDAAELVKIGVKYLRVEGIFYIGIGWLFLFYGYFRGINLPGISLLLTVISLGTRVLLAYTLSPISKIGVVGIWIAIPIGWILADLAGLYFMKKYKGDRQYAEF